MGKTRQVVFYFFLINFSAAVLYAAEQNDAPASVQNEIRVSAKKPGKGIEGTYRQISLTEGNEAASARNTSEIIEKQPGVRLNRYGPPGTFSSLSIRGSNTEQVGIYIEGIPLNDAFGGSVNIENLPPVLFDSLEMYSSGSPVHLPGSHIGGAVDFTIRDLPNELTYSLNAGVHSLKGGQLGVGMANRHTAHFIEVAGSANQYTYLDDNGTPFFNTDDDTLRTRQNEDFYSAAYTGLYRAGIGKTKITLLGDVFANERGLPGVVGNENRRVRLQTGRAITRVAGETPVAASLLLKTRGYFHLGNSVLKDPLQELAAGFVSQTRLNMTGGLGFGLLWFASNHLNIQFNHESRYTNINRDSVFLTGRAEVENGVSLEYYFVPGMVRLTASGKIIYLDDTPGAGVNTVAAVAQPAASSEFLPAGSARLGFFLSDALQKLNVNFGGNKPHFKAELFAAASYSERFPSVTEKYGDGGLLLPALSLKKENSITNSAGIEAGGYCGFLYCQISTAWYLTGMNNLILFIANSQRTMIATNVGRAQIQGFETEARVSYKKTVSAVIRYHYMDAVDKSNLPSYYNKFLPFRPRHSFNANVEAGTETLRFFSSVDFIGANFRDRYNSYFQYLEQRVRVNAGFSYIFDPGASEVLTFTVKNILNDLQVDIIGYPLPGRVFEIMYRVAKL